MTERPTTGNAGNHESGVLSSPGSEIIDCLRLNGLDVDVNEVDGMVAVHLVKADGTELPAVRFRREGERDALTALAAVHCSNGQWVRMAYYDGLPLQNHRL